MSSRINSISGDYQYKALLRGSLIQRQWHKNRHNLIEYLSLFKKNDVVLDAGCGSGNVILEYAPKVKSIVGIDNNFRCITFLNKKIKETNLNNASCFNKDLLKPLLLGNKKFSKIILSEVIEHFSESDVKLLLKNLKNVLADNGRILITTPNYSSSWVLIEKIIDACDLSPTLWGEQHLIKFTPKRLKNIAEECGFRTEKIGTLNLLSPFVAIVSQPIADKLSFREFSLPFGNLIYAVVKKSKQ